MKIVDASILCLHFLVLSTHKKMRRQVGKHRAVARVVTVLQLKKDAFRQQKLPKAKHQNPEERREDV